MGWGCELGMWVGDVSWGCESGLMGWVGLGLVCTQYYVVVTGLMTAPPCSSSIQQHN